MLYFIQKQSIIDICVFVWTNTHTHTGVKTEGVKLSHLKREARERQEKWVKGGKQRTNETRKWCKHRIHLSLSSVLSAQNKVRLSSPTASSGMFWWGQVSLKMRAQQSLISSPASSISTPATGDYPGANWNIQFVTKFDFWVSFSTRQKQTLRVCGQVGSHPKASGKSWEWV